MQRFTERESHGQQRHILAAARLRQHNSVRSSSHDHVEVAVGERRGERIYSHKQKRRILHVPLRLEECKDLSPRLGFLADRYQILEIENKRVGACP